MHALQVEQRNRIGLPRMHSSTAAVGPELRVHMLLLPLNGLQGASAHALDCELTSENTSHTAEKSEKMSSLQPST